MSIYNNSIVEDVRYQFQHGSMVIRLILICVGVYLADNFLYLLLFLFNNAPLHSTIMEWFMVCSKIPDILFKPWSFITYIFLHADFWHILFNMIVLYIFGRILVDMIGNRKILPIFILGGIAGAVMCILMFNIFPVFKPYLSAPMLGASAGVMSVMLATATLRPNYSIMLVFLGAVQIKYIALFFVLLDFTNIAVDNPGGHIAHLGGALFGYVFIKQLKNGNDLSIGFNKVWDAITGLFDPKNKPRVAYRNTKATSTNNAGSSSSGNYYSYKPQETPRVFDSAKQEKIDTILDKIAHSGYDSLSNEEKEFLFNVSKEDV